ncbi:MAG: sulfate transporter CysZ [Gammaproteobacteria bacterium]
MTTGSDFSLTRDINNNMTHAPYLLQGALLLLRPGYKRFILIPLACNLALFIVSMLVLISYLNHAAAQYMQWIPDWLQAIEVIMWFIVGFGIFFLYSLTFTSITNLLAAPFNGFLSEKIQADTTGEPLPDDTLWSMTLRTLKREFQKLLYFVLYGLLVSIILFIISFIPLLNVCAPILGIAWVCWSLGIQYIDYAADNNHIEFQALRRWCAKRRLRVVMYGGTVLLITLIPIVNVIVMSAAVAGGTLFWLNEKQHTAS